MVLRRRPTRPGRAGLALGLAALVVFAAPRCLVVDVGGRATDGGAPDASPRPGDPCIHPDPCVRVAFIGEDGRCRADIRRTCDDQLPCTADACTPSGQCANSVIPGFCLVDSAFGGKRCEVDGAPNPDNTCQYCIAARSSTGWTTVADGELCDDDDSCTHTDRCVSGTCVGIDYGGACDDGLPCTTDGCDGQGGCLPNTLLPGHCLIDGKCWAAEVSYPGTPPQACATCDPKVNAFAWTISPHHCLIDGLCRLKRETNKSDCTKTCDPSQDKFGWTTTNASCWIGGTCHGKGDPGPLKQCEVCAPTRDLYGWSVAPGTCRIGGTCYQQGAKKPGSSTCSCVPGVSQTSWTCS